MATTEEPRRVRVVLADAARARQGGEPTKVEIVEQTLIGEALVRGLIRTQLAIALRCAGVVAVGLGGLPLLFAAAPEVAGTRPFGVSLPWLLLGVAAYPFLLLVGWAYVHLAERTERDFVDLVEKH
jgi:hypothetical protein